MLKFVFFTVEKVGCDVNTPPPLFCLFVFQDATRSRRCSVTPRQLCCALAVQQSCVSPLEAKRVSQRVSITCTVYNIISLAAWCHSRGFIIQCLQFHRPMCCACTSMRISWNMKCLVETEKQPHTLIGLFSSSNRTCWSFQHHFDHLFNRLP